MRKNVKSTNQIPPKTHALIRLEKIILFGSYGKGNATADSDIDVAIISPQLGKAPLLEKMRLFEWRYEADMLVDIQPVPIGLHEYESSSSFFIREVNYHLP